MRYEIKNCEKLQSVSVISYVALTYLTMTREPVGMAYKEGEENVSHDTRTAGGHDVEFWLTDQKPSKGVANEDGYYRGLVGFAGRKSGADIQRGKLSLPIVARNKEDCQIITGNSILPARLRKT